MYKKANEEEEFEKKIKDIEKNGEKEEKKVSNKGNGKGLYVKGLDNLLIKTAKCCNPVPGDEIIGYITQGNGISVHRTNCLNVAKLMQEHNRLIDVYWNDNTTENYAVEIEVLAVNTSDILKNIIQVIEKSKSSLLGVEANVNKLKLAVIKVKIIVKNHEELNKIMNSLKSVENVLETSRKRG